MDRFTQIILIIIPFLFSLALFFCVKIYKKKTNKFNNVNVVKYPAWIFYLGIIGTSELILGFIFNDFKTKILFGFFIILGLFCIILQVSFRIYFFEDTIKYRAFFRKRTYCITDVECVKSKGKFVIVYLKNGEKFDFDFELCEGSVNFCRYLNGLDLIKE